MNKRSIKFILILIFFQYPQIQFAIEEPGSSEFEIFDDTENTSEENNSDISKNSYGLQIDMVFQKRWLQPTFIFSDEKKIPIETSIFLQSLRFNKSIHFLNIIELIFDGASYYSNEGKKYLINNIDSNAQNSNPFLNEELSFLHFYTYELSIAATLNNKSNNIILKTGVLPVQQGNSFYKNPVSFFERYLPARNYLLEYNPLSFPGFSLIFINKHINTELLYVPFIPFDKLDEKSYMKHQAEYMYFINPAHVVMLKNSFPLFFSLNELYFFYENNPHLKKKNHFAIGNDMQIPLFSDLSFSLQFLTSNGQSKYYLQLHKINSIEYYSLDPVPDSANIFYTELIVALNLNFLNQKSFSIGYYYNGIGYNQEEFNRIIQIFGKIKSNSKSNNSNLFSINDYLASEFFKKDDFFQFNRHYLFLNLISTNDLNLFSWGVSSFFTLERFSIFPVIFINYQITPDMKLYIHGSTSAGVQNAVFKEFFLSRTLNTGVQWNF